MALFTPDPDRPAKLIADAAFAAIAVTIIVLSQEYAPKVRAFPLIVSWTMLILVALDLVSQTDTRLGRLISALVGKDLDSAKARVERPNPIFGLIWVPVYAVSVYLIGFLLTAALYGFVSMAVFGRAKPLHAGLFAAGLTALVWVFFELILGFALFRGVLFGDRG